MRNEAAMRNLSASGELELAQDMRNLIEDLNVGIAIYGSNGHLLTANENFYAFHCINMDEFGIGTSFIDIIEQSLKSKQVGNLSTQPAYDAIMSTLKKSGSYRIELLDRSSQKLRVSRHLKSNDMIIETVEMLSSDASSNNFSQQDSLKHAPSLTVAELTNALNDTPDGFGIYSAEGHLLAYNKSYVTLNPDIAHVIRIGALHRDIIGAVYDSGEIEMGGMTRQEFLAFAEKERLEPSGPTAHKNSNGRWVRFSGTRLENGYTIFNVSDITQIKQHEDLTQKLSDKAADQEQRLQDALTNMSQGICLYDENGRAIVFNDQYIDQFGMDHAIAKVGVSRYELVKSAVDANKYPPEIGQKMLLLYKEANFGQEETNFLHHFADGRIMEVHNKPLANGKTIVVGTDVTQREADARRITEQGIQLNNALTNMSQGLAMFNEHQEVLVWNEQYLNMTGVDPALMKFGARRLDILRNSIQRGHYSEQKASDTINLYETHGFTGTDSIIHHYLADGRIIEVHNRPLANNYTIVTMSDVTQREQDTARLAKYTRNLERSNAELQDFAYVASHDLQEPLRKIEAFGDRLAKKYSDVLEEDGAMYLDRMQNASSRMRQLINDLLSYSRVTAKKRPFIPVDLNDVIEGVLSDLHMRLEDTGGKVETEGLGTIEGDAVQLRQLFQNLINNALKFQKPGVKPIIRVVGETVEIEDEFGMSADIHRIKVIDNGIGFDNRFKDQIFSIFKRLHGRTEYEGTGIGLSTCRKIVDQHLGQIEAEGQEGNGATFNIDIPVKHVSEDTK